MNLSREAPHIQTSAALPVKARTCVGCGGAVSRNSKEDAQVRCVISPEGILGVDVGNKTHGRGVYVHSRAGCFRDACSRGFARSAKRSLQIIREDGSLSSLNLGDFVQMVQLATNRRIAGLLTSAVRCRELAMGADAVSEAVEKERAALVIVATDARSAAELSVVRHWIALGRCVAWGTKKLIGNIVSQGQREVGVVAVLSSSIAQAISQSMNTLDACCGSNQSVQRHTEEDLLLVQTSSRLEFVHE